MPTYDYKCDACGHAFEKFQSITAAPIRKCPECGRSKARRLIGIGAGVIFKGGGFYETDYRSDSYKADAKKDSGDGGKPESGEQKKPETKADAGSDKTSTAGESKPATKAESTSKPKTDAKQPA